MSQSYNASKTHVKFPVSNPKPKPTKVLSSGTAKHFVPGLTQKAGHSMGGKVK
jgi:hypothetical protein